MRGCGAGKEKAGAGVAGRLRERLRSGPPLLLDGATGTELERRGAYTGLPLWGTHALLDRPELVAEIHADYAAAGAEILTANTFRTQRRALDHGGIGRRAAELTARAVHLAREGARRAGRGDTVLIAGSDPTLEDCYQPDRVPEDAALEREHAEHQRNLAEAGADLLLIETINSIREAVAALRVARGLPAVVSFICDGHARLLSGEPLRDALAAVAGLGPLAVCVNCLPPSAVPPCLPVLRGSGLPFGVYANLGAPADDTGFARTEDCTPEQLAGLAAEWCAAGARIAGGCCGTTPAHVRAIAERLAGGLSAQRVP